MFPVPTCIANPSRDRLRGTYVSRHRHGCVRSRVESINVGPVGGDDPRSDPGPVDTGRGERARRPPDARAFLDDVCIVCHPDRVRKPQANHTIRTLPPAMSAGMYAQGHDEGIWAQRGTPSPKSQGARPSRTGRSSWQPSPCVWVARVVFSFQIPAACWASWVDALPMIEKRNPAIAEMVAMADDEALQEGCLSPEQLQTWTAKGSRGDPRGQIFSGASVHQRTSRRNPWRVATWLAVLVFFRLRHPFQEDFHAVWPDCREPGTLRSHSGRNAGVALAHAPTARECTIPPTSIRVLLLERMRFAITEARCSGCHALLETTRTPQSNMHTIRENPKMCTPIERTLARVFREQEPGCGSTHTFLHVSLDPFPQTASLRTGLRLGSPTPPSFLHARPLETPKDPGGREEEG